MSPTGEHSVTRACTASHTFRKIFQSHIVMIAKHTVHHCMLAVLYHLDTHHFVKPMGL